MLHSCPGISAKKENGFLKPKKNGIGRELEEMERFNCIRQHILLRKMELITNPKNE